MAKIDNIDRPTDAAFILFYLSGEIAGITKVQKLLFLMEKESAFGEKYKQDISFDFDAYKMGPFSPKVYEEVEFLQNIGAIEQEPLEHTASDSYEISKYTNSEEGSEGLSNKQFRMTDKGKKIARELVNVLEENEVEELNEMLSKYNEMSLMHLLEYVYTTYPEMTSRSEIKEQVLG
ncbi:type II toxin-antitoxin system antitoxin SocA domain-containing protein [Haladaptatus sp. ZSTT2]|uniref:type II toxin-antitoxin system antitoxin SocA domain-containing protein n=1 Tax=Haladaptatus sp. ZSTT2 TaxID=3120515 RepID=UPI00300E8C65